MYENNLIKNAPFHLSPLEEMTGALPYSMTNDLLCKMLLERNQQVLRSLLASMLRIPRESITDLQILNPYTTGQSLTDKDVILDLKATINHELRIDLEVQVAKEIFWKERSILYSGRLFDFLSMGESYADLQKSIHIGILGFDLFTEEQAQFYSRFMFMEEKDHKIYSDKLQIVVLQLNQINLATEEDKVHNIHRWARFFKATTWEELHMLAKEDAIFHEAATTIQQITAEEIHRENLRCREKYLLSMRTRDFIEAQQKNTIALQAEEISQLKEQISQQSVQISQLVEMVAELKAEKTEQS